MLAIPPAIEYTECDQYSSMVFIHMLYMLSSTRNSLNLKAVKVVTHQI